jgi:hypothetical protein
LRIYVSRSDGNKARRSKYFRDLVDDEGNFTGGVPMSDGMIMKKPGESTISSIDLNKLYELKPGKYTVRVSHR